MPDNLTVEDRRRTMQAVRGKNTSLERRLFAMVAGMRLKGWRRNANDILGKPDVVFPAYKVLLFADGCYWHGCPVCKRKLPETNKEYWERKISRNIERDQEHNKVLGENGWKVLRIWEHELRTPEGRARVKERIRSALEETGNDGAQHGNSPTEVESDPR